MSLQVPTLTCKDWLEERHEKVQVFQRVIHEYSEYRCLSAFVNPLPKKRAEALVLHAEHHGENGLA